MEDPGGDFLKAMLGVLIMLMQIPLAWVAGFVCVAKWLEIEPVASTWTTGDCAQTVALWLAAYVVGALIGASLKSR